MVRDWAVSGRAAQWEAPWPGSQGAGQLGLDLSSALPTWALLSVTAEDDNYLLVSYNELLWKGLACSC